MKPDCPWARQVFAHWATALALMVSICTELLAPDNLWLSSKTCILFLLHRPFKGQLSSSDVGTHRLGICPRGRMLWKVLSALYPSFLRRLSDGLLSLPAWHNQIFSVRHSQLRNPLGMIRVFGGGLFRLSTDVGKSSALWVASFPRKGVLSYMRAASEQASK